MINIKLILQLILLVAAIAALGYYFYYIWSDCLDENSILTCMRMLR
jgi:hypothetical protein